jgi:hypothetical protein
MSKAPPPPCIWSLAVVASGALTWLLASTALFGGDARPSAADKGAQRIEEMNQLVKPLRAAKIDGTMRVRLQLHADPLHRWNDPTREFSDGCLWMWTTRNRPAAALATELYPNQAGGQHWSLEFVSLSTSPLEIEGDTGFQGDPSQPPPPEGAGKLIWTPKTNGVEFKDLEGGPAPAETESARLRQMKLISQRFSGEEFYKPSNQTYTLRRLPRDVYRYSSPEFDVVDGAVFMLVHGTNPEILLLIEAQGKDWRSATWRYALARLSTAAPTARLDQKVVWQLPATDAHFEPDATYFISHKQRARADQATP